MFLEVLLYTALGIIVGIFCGLLPGIHPNLVSILLISFLVGAAGTGPPYPYIAFIVAVSVTNVVVNFIPTIFLSVPDSGMELGVLPGHRLLLKGQGLGAVRLGIIGALGGVIFSLLLFPLVILVVPKIYMIIQPNLHIILSGIVLFFILKDREPVAAAGLFLLSGLLGLTSSKLPIDQNLVLFPLLTGLFGLSMLLVSIKNKTKIPTEENELFVSGQTITNGVVKGSFGGMTTGLLPGIGPSAAAMLFSSGSAESFLVTIGAITGSNVLFSFLALWLIGKARSGAAVALRYFMGTLSFVDCMFIVFTGLLSLGFAVLITQKLSSHIMKLLKKINYALLSATVFVFTLSMIILLTGVWGFVVAAIAAALGMIPNLSRVRRVHLMGVLLLPTILFYAGFTF